MKIYIKNNPNEKMNSVSYNDIPSSVYRDVIKRFKLWEIGKVHGECNGFIK